MEFLGIFAFFWLWFLLQKCILVQSAFSAALVAWKFFEKKKLDAGFEIFHIFKPKNDPFFQFLDPLDFRAEGPEKIGIF